MEEAKRECVERGAVPPAVHVGFTESKAALGENAVVERAVFYLYIVRLGSVECYSSRVKLFLEQFFYMIVEHCASCFGGGRCCLIR